VQIYFEPTPQWAVNDESQPVTFEKIEKEGLTFLKTGTVEQPVLQKRGDDLRIDWGYFYLAGRKSDASVINFGDYWSSKNAFLTTGTIPAEDQGELSEKMTLKMTVLA